MSKLDNSTILIVNDAVDALELLRLQLHEAGYQVLTAMSGREGFDVALHQRPDMVVSDVEMPEVNGIELCRMIRAEDGLRTVPILLVSAIHKEDAKVVEGLKAGADDYLEVPDNQSRLVAKVARLLERKRAEEALQEAHDELESRVKERTGALLNANARLKQEAAERQQAEQALRAHHSLLQGVIEGTTDCIFAKDLNGRYLMVNSASASFIGKSAGEIIGKNDPELFPPEIAQQLIEHDHQVYASDGVLILEETLAYEGMPRTALVTKNVYRNDKGEAIGLIGIARDITERKRAEDKIKESERQLAIAQQVAHLGSWEWQLSTNKVSWSDELYRITGLTPQQFSASYEGFLERVHLNDRKFVNRIIEKALRGHKPFDFEHRIVRTDGEVRTLRSRGEVVTDKSGQAAKMYGIAEDITERKRVEDALRASEERYRDLFENANDIIYTHDLQGNYTSVNKAGARITGYTHAEALRMNIADIIAPEHLEQARQRIAHKVADGASSTGYELEIISKDGGRIALEIKSRLILQDGVMIGIQGIARDITERKRTQEALRASEERYRVFINQSSEAIWRFELETPIPITLPEDDQIELFYRHSYLAECNVAMARMYGYSSPEEIVGTRLGDLFVQSDSQNTEFLRAAVRMEYQLTGVESHEVDRDGNSKWFLNNFVGIVEDGFLIRVWGTQRDVTEQKRTEEARRRAEEKYRSIFENAVEGIFQSTPDGRFLSVNPAMARMYGYDSPEEMISELSDIERQHYVDPERRAEFRRLLEDQEGVVQGFESEVYRKDKSRFWISESVRAVKDQTGVLLYYEGFIVDITERKRAEDALAESEDRYRDLVEHSQDLMCTHDLEGRIISVNPWAAETLGYDPDDLLKKNIQDLLVPEALDGFDDYLAAIRTNGFARGLMHVQTAAGERRIWEYNNTLRAHGVAAPIVRGMAHDITERTRTEEALRQSERDYRGLFENAHDAIIVLAPNGETVLEVNQRACEIYGFSRSEFIGMSLETVSQDIARGRVRVKETLEHGTFYNFETVQYRKDGTEMSLDINASVVDYKGVRAILSINRDITERKRAEEALRESEARHHAILKAQPDLMFSLSTKGVFLDFHAKSQRDLLLPPEQFLGKNMRDVLPLELADKIADCFKQVTESSEPCIIEFSLPIGDDVRYYEARIVRCGTDEILCVSRNITERKQAEKERTQLLRRLVVAQEEERHRIARELHDYMGQYLAALMLELKLLKDSSQAAPHIQSAISKLQEMTAEFSQGVRHLALELRPPALEDLGLHAALSNYLERWWERYGIIVDLHTNGLLNRRFPAYAEIALYRVVQEALNNVLKHAQAQHVSLVLEYRGGRVLAIIEDDGCGFNVDAALNAPVAERRLGLTGMRERVESAGGTLGIESSPGVGTTLVVRIPVSSKKKVNQNGEDGRPID